MTGGHARGGLERAVVMGEQRAHARDARRRATLGRSRSRARRGHVLHADERALVLVQAVDRRHRLASQRFTRFTTRVGVDEWRCPACAT